MVHNDDDALVLIDASNLHHGGGVQVAASVVNELGRLRKLGIEPQWPWIHAVHVEVSSAVNAALDPSGMEIPHTVVNRSPRSVLRWLPRRRRFPVSFTIFGPDYGWRRARTRILGYADVTSIYPTPPGVPASKRVSRMRRSIRGAVSRRLLHKADVIIVETDAFAAAIRQRVPLLKTPINVVPNCINGSLTEHFPIVTREPSPPYRLLYVAQGYAHKNHRILGHVAAELEARGFRVEFWLTLTRAQWDGLDVEVQSACRNLGELVVTELASVYEQVDGVVFPSLLESFSAAPLEAMAAGHVVFVSDRDFIRSVCKGGAVYLDPLDPIAWARAIEEWILNPTAFESTREAAQAVVANLTNPSKRLQAYGDIITKMLGSTGTVES